MSQERLTKELISDPSMWRLSIEIGREYMDVVIHSAIEGNSLIHRRIALSDTDAGMQSIEDAVYDNPLLLGDFGKTDVLIDTQRFTMVPTGSADEDLRQDLMSAIWPDGDYMVMADQLSSTGTSLLMAVDTPLLAFVQRTFPDAKVSHRLTPIITYFYNKERLNNSSRLYALISDKRVDVVLIKNGVLNVANTFDTPTFDDVLYFIMAVASNADFDLNQDEIMLAGQHGSRSKLSAELRKYVNYVMPVVFPSSLMQTSNNAMDTPFELLLLPLCE